MSVPKPAPASVEDTVRGTVEDLIMPPMEPGKAYLIVIRGPSVGRMLELDGSEAILGRSPDVTLPVEDEGASRRHAAVALEEGGYAITDLHSTNGLFVNGVRVERHTLHHADRIQIGTSSVLKFCFQDEVEEAFQKTLYDAATRDPLVGIYNRRYFTESLTSEVAHSLRRDVPLSLLMLDLDHFKRVNDTYGHLAGDQALIDIARLVQAYLRAGDTLARYGGEEFALILRHSPSSGAAVLAERLRRAVEQHAFAHEGRDFRLTVSIGIATLQGGSYGGADDLLRAADAALYEAKTRGRNQVVSAEPGGPE